MLVYVTVALCGVAYENSSFNQERLMAEVGDVHYVKRYVTRSVSDSVGILLKGIRGGGGGR